MFLQAVEMLSPKLLSSVDNLCQLQKSPQDNVKWEVENKCASKDQVSIFSKSSGSFSWINGYFKFEKLKIMQILTFEQHIDLVLEKYGTYYDQAIKCVVACCLAASGNGRDFRLSVVNLSVLNIPLVEYVNT